MNTHTNPLLALGPRLPFDRIEPAHVGPAIEQLIGDAKAKLAAISALDGPRTYANTLEAFEQATAPLEDAFGLVGHLEGLVDAPALRDAYNAAQPQVSAFIASIPHDTALYAALRAYGETDDAAKLDGTRARLLEKTLDDFRRHGAELDADDKARLMAIEVELAEVTNRFAQTVVDDTDAFEWVCTDIAQLDGLPESALATAKASAEARGIDGWRFTLQAPSMDPIMRYLHDGAIRERFYRAYNNRATTGERDNRPRVERILALRQQKAELLGFTDVADLLLEQRMARTGAAASEFVEGLHRRTLPAFRREHTELEAFRAETLGPGAAPMQAWDLGYWAEAMRQAKLDFDAEALRPYFEAETVLSGMFDLVGRLFGVKVSPLSSDDWPTWHPDVRVYGLDDDDGTRLGVFYVDLFPRTGKQGGAWMRPLLLGDPANGVPHVGQFAANLSPPTGGRPALLVHREVETIFHEFGHLLHHLLTRVPVRALAGTNVPWDFVELPSQIMENWCWDRQALDLFARHHETGEPIPDELFERMQAARTFRAGYRQMRQLGFATVDLGLHRRYDAAKHGDAMAFAYELAGDFSPVPLPEPYGMIAGFTHLFAHPVGYGAGYYSYKWAEVLDADAFTRFEKEGVFSAEVGGAFRREVLERGDSRDPAESYAAFMGRGPDAEALFDRARLTAQGA